MIEINNVTPLTSIVVVCLIAGVAFFAVAYLAVVVLYELGVVRMPPSIWGLRLFTIGVCLTALGMAIWGARDTRQEWAQLENAYGISRLECRGGDCTWVDARNNPAIGTLVHRDDMAGLLDSNQKPLPLVGDAGGQS